MSLPKVSVLYSNGNLLADITVIDGIMGLMVTVADAGKVGVVHKFNNLAEAVAAGFTEADEPFAYRQISEFYDELAGNQELWVMGTVDTETMTQSLDKDDTDAAPKLLAAAQGKIRILAVGRKPNAGYDAGAAFWDSDIESALAKAKALVVAQRAKLEPIAVVVEGRINDVASLDIFDIKTAEADACFVVAGGSVNDGSASVGTLLGRAALYAAHIKIGKVANGPLAIQQIYIGDKELKDFGSLESLHDLGVISFMQHHNKAGFYFGIDKGASTGDYRLLAYCRVVDKAAIITEAVYIEEIEDEVKLNEDGTMDELEIEHLKGVITQHINNAMGDQISNLFVIIDPKQKIIDQGNKLKVKLRVQPLGYKSFIEVDLGLTAAA
jgi:hypothetical protein